MSLKKASVFHIQTQKSPNRIELLDFLRGAGMLLVLTHHSDIPDNPAHLILAFHMPFMFLISGYAMHLRSVPVSFRTFIGSRFLRLIVPYFLFEGVNLLVWSVSLFLQGGWQDVTEAVTAILTCINTEGYTGYYGRLWFWPCMFVSDIYFYWILRFAPKKEIARKTYLFFMILAMFGISWYTSKMLPSQLPFTIDTAFMATAFLLTGYLFGHAITWLTQKDHRFADIGLLLVSIPVMSRAISQCGSTFMMFINSYGHYGHSVCAALCGILITLILSKWLYRLVSGRTLIINTVLWYGYNSLATFPIHLSVKIWIYQTFPLSYRQWYILLPAMFFLNIPLVNLVTKYCPFMLGKIPFLQQKKSTI